jgi:hypothetical protein
MAAEKAKGEWIPSTVSVRELQSLEEEGFLPPRAQGEIVGLVSHVERGISFPFRTSAHPS